MEFGMRFHEREKTLLNNCGYLKHTKLQDLSEFVSPHTHIYAPGSPTQTYDERIQNAILFNRLASRNISSATFNETAHQGTLSSGISTQSTQPHTFAAHNAGAF